MKLLFYSHANKTHFKNVVYWVLFWKGEFLGLGNGLLFRFWWVHLEFCWSQMAFALLYKLLTNKRLSHFKLSRKGFILEFDAKESLYYNCYHYHYCSFSLLLFYCQLEDPAEIRNMMNELTNKVNKLQTTLQRIQAPNMKALEK